MSEPYIPTDRELRDRVETVAVPSYSNRTPVLHIATIPSPGGSVKPHCGRERQSTRNGGRGKQDEVKPWKVKEPAVYPGTSWCRACSFMLWNKRYPSNEELGAMTGDAYE